MELNKEEAIEFARKYLEDRKGNWRGKHESIEIERAWDIAVEYMLLDIIPYIYGDALD